MLSARSSSLLFATALLSAVVCQSITRPDVSEDANQYVVFQPGYNRTHECCCSNLKNAPKFDYICVVRSRNGGIGDCRDGEVACSQLPFLIVYGLFLNCSNCTACVQVNLHELTKVHVDTGRPETRVIYPPQIVHLENCHVDSFQVGFIQLQTEKVSIDTSMEVAPFGSPDMPGVGGYLTVNVTFPDQFNESDCRLLELNMESTDNIWYLPAYVMHKCTRLNSVRISNSPIEWVSIRDILALRNVFLLKLSNCRLKSFANDALAMAIDLLDTYIESEITSGCISNTEAAIKALIKTRSETGRLSSPIFLYDFMDTVGINFSLLFGHRSKVVSNKSICDMPHKMALTDLDLSYNDLTSIPFSISLFDQLNNVNLSHNRINSLYHGWICWYPPIPEDKRKSSNRHCYWFRAARASLKVLDLSYNRIDQIGEIEPWHQVALSDLRLQGNRIISINPEGFSHSYLASSLLFLNLDNNEFPYFLLAKLTRIEVLSIKSCKVSNIEPGSLPRSSYLRKIYLDNNQISAIAANVFADLTSLEFVGLRNNSMLHFFADSFLMPCRSTLGSRVILDIADQARTPICDCNHVYKKILKEEEFSNPRGDYRYPRIADLGKNSSCQFFSRLNQSIVTKPLIESTQKEFLCEFEDTQKHKLPVRYCNPNETENGVDACYVRCIVGCKCYHDDIWDISDLDCTSSNSTIKDLVKMRFEFPIKYLYLSGLKDSEFFRHVSNGSLKWNNESNAAELLVLELSNSNVKYVEKGAFNKFPKLVVIFLHDNNISRIDIGPFSDRCRLKDRQLRTNVTQPATMQDSGYLRQITLHNNSLEYIDPRIINGTCPHSLTDISLSGNKWHCSCQESWLELHQALINTSRTTQIVSDFHQMRCTIDQVIVDTCAQNKANPIWKENCKNISIAIKSQAKWNSAMYPVNDEGRLIAVCKMIADTAAEQLRLILGLTVAFSFGLVLLSLLVLAIRRRHRLLAVVRVLVLLKYQRDSRVKQQVSRDSMPYDAMLWASDRDQDSLVDVLNCVRHASGGEQLELCVPESFLYSDLCSCPLTYFDCPAEGAKFSGKVVVALSERFLDTEYLALLQVIRELNSVGRCPFKDIVFLRLSSHRVPLQRQRQLGPEDVEAFATLRRILAGSEIVYKSVDWEYRLIKRIRNRSVATSVIPSQEFPSVSGLETRAAEIPGLLADPTAEDQPLIVDVQPPDVPKNMFPKLDWPPFHSDSVPEVFFLAATEPTCESNSDLLAATRTAMNNIVSRLSGVILGTNDEKIVAGWPDDFQAATPADRIDAFLMKRTRQFVLLLSNSLLSWLKERAALQVEFQSFLAANCFRRRVLVILVGQVDNRSRIRYQALANQRLDNEGTAETAQNWFDMAADGDVEAFGRWLDVTLFRRPE